jgi:Stress responsive A/B Barrel Domain
MREHLKRSGGAGLMIAICASALCGSCTIAPERSRPPQHVVLIWLKHPRRAGDRAQLIRAAHSMRMIPGVTQVEVGRTAPELGPGVDRNFDLAVVVTFRDAAALKRYEEDPRLRAAMERYLNPLVRHYEVRDLGVR